MHRLAKEYEKPQFDIQPASRVDGVEVAVQEQVALGKPFCRLLRFKRFTDDAQVLRAHEGAAHRAGGGAAVGPPRNAAARHGARCCCATTRSTSPTGPTRAWCRRATARSTSTTTSHYVQEFIRHDRPRTCNVISVCQPTVPVLAAVSLMASARRADAAAPMTMMGGPIDARKSPTAVQQPGDEQELRVVREQRDLPRAAPTIPAHGRRVYPGFLQHTGFVAMNPDRHMSSHYDYFIDLVRGDDDSADAHRQLLRRVQRRARHAGRVLPRHHQDRVPGVRAGQRHLGRRRRAGAPAGHHDAARC